MKVRTSAEQAELQRKELQAKTKAYQKLCGAIMAKVRGTVRTSWSLGAWSVCFPDRLGLGLGLGLGLCSAEQPLKPTVARPQKKSQLLDPEALSLTEMLLSKNPDFGTLFNFRRDILAHLFVS